MTEKKDFIFEAMKKQNLFSQGWELEIQETQQFKDRNIVVLINAKGKHLFMKAVKMLDGFIELTPISRQEAELNQINYEESLNESYFEATFEESQGEIENGKIIHKFNSQDPESMRQAAKTAQEIADRLEGKTQDVNVKVLEEENEDLRSKLDLIATQKFMEKKRSLGAPDDITSPEELMGYEKAIKGKTQPSQSIPSGTVPLSSQQPAKSEGFGDYPSMVADLRKRAETDPIAREALTQLMYKSLKGAKEATLPPYVEPPKQTISTDLIENGKLVARPDVCGLSHAYREKKLRAMAEKGDQSALAILNSGDY
jgi:hypothetical protein